MIKYIVPKIIDGQEATFINIWQTFNSMDTNPETGGHALIQYTIFTSTGTAITTGYIRIDGESYYSWDGNYEYAANYIATELELFFLLD
jgi:hypothetical protein